MAGLLGSLFDTMGMNSLGSNGLLGNLTQSDGWNNLHAAFLAASGNEKLASEMMARPGIKAASSQFENALMGGQPQMPPMGGQSTPNYGNAIAGIESGGKYDALGPVTKTGDRAFGKYQVMGANIGPWSQEVLGQPVTPQQFLASPEIQDKVFQAKFGSYVQKYGPEGAAKAWFAGEGGMNNPNAKDQLGTSVASYAQKFNNALGPQTLVGQSAGTPPGPGPRLESPPQAAQPSPQMAPAPAGPNVQALMKALANPNLPASSRALGTMLLQKEWDKNKPTDDIREFEYAKERGFNGTLEEWVQRKRSGAGEYGLNPIWGTGPDGKPAIIQLGKGGKAIQTEIPGGVQVGKDVIKIDAGTHYILLDPVTRQPLGQVSKNIEQKEAAEERGKATGTAQVNLSNVEAQSQQALDNIKQIREHPGKKWGTGATGIIPGIPGTDQRGFVALVDQLKGKTFLEAYNTLKGGGAITEVEGKKAEMAIARLDRAQSPADFETSLRDLENVIRAGMIRAKQKAGGISAPGPAAPLADPLGIR